MRPTPSSLAETPHAILNCPFNPVEGKNFLDHTPSGDLPMREIQTMPTMRKMVISGDSRSADRIRKTFIENATAFGGELYMQTLGNIDMTAQLMAYKVPVGSYYPRVREWLFEAFSSMEPDKVYFLQFTSYDAIQLAFHYVNSWQEESAAIMRLGATYEGRKLTLRAFKPRATMNQHEYERLLKLEKKAEKIREERARAARKLERAANPNAGIKKPYHAMDVHQSITLGADQFTAIKNLRNVVYRYGSAAGKKFSISEQEDGSVVITRTA